MASALSINANERQIAIGTATPIIARHTEEQEIKSTDRLTLGVRRENEIDREAQAEAESIFDREEYLINLLYDTQARDPGLAVEISEAIHEAITARRRALYRTPKQTA